jgi:hypothetical protein
MGNHDEPSLIATWARITITSNLANTYLTPVLQLWFYKYSDSWLENVTGVTACKQNAGQRRQRIKKTIALQVNGN